MHMWENKERSSEGRRCTSEKKTLMMYLSTRGAVPRVRAMRTGTSARAMLRNPKMTADTYSKTQTRTQTKPKQDKDTDICDGPRPRPRPRNEHKHVYRIQTSESIGRTALRGWQSVPEESEAIHYCEHRQRKRQIQR